MKTLFTEEERQALRESTRTEKQRQVAQAFAKRGTVHMPRIDPHEYPKKRGLEGPFQFRTGRVLYYDPREGRYYDSKTDMYMDRDFDPARD